MIILENVSKTFAGVPAVADVSLEIEAQSLTVLVGESGCGKTTTLKTINRLVEPTAGRILIDGKDNREMDPVRLRRQIGYVFQGIGLFPHMSVADNVALVPRMSGWEPSAVAARVDELLELVGLEPARFATRPPAELSGGERQRVGVARALAARPSIVLMDEPFGALDPITRDELQQQLRTWQRSLGLTVVLVTHDMTEALLLADRLAVMRAGRLVAYGQPSALVADPPHEYVAELMSMPRRQAERIARMASAGVHEPRA